MTKNASQQSFKQDGGRKETADSPLSDTVPGLDALVCISWQHPSTTFKGYARPSQLCSVLGCKILDAIYFSLTHCNYFSFRHIIFLI